MWTESVEPIGDKMFEDDSKFIFPQDSTFFTTKAEGNSCCRVGRIVSK